MKIQSTPFTPPAALPSTPAWFRSSATSKFLAAMLFSITGLQPLSAGLPILGEYPWTGCFAGYADKNYRFELHATGEIRITALGAKQEPVMPKLVVLVTIALEETLPNGKIVVRKIDPESMESTQAATNELEKVVVRGKVTGDAAFELTLEQNRGMVLIGGKVVDPGNTKNPLRFSARSIFAAPYPFYKDNITEEAAKVFHKQIKGDSILLKTTDNQERTLTMDQVVDAAAADASGSNIASADIDIRSYDGKTFHLIASPNSALTLESRAKQPLLKGFSLVWRADPAKDPEAKARLAIGVR